MTETIHVANVARYRITSSTQPHVGVSIQLFIATPSGEAALQPVWLPAEAAQALARALNKEVLRARSAS